MTLVPAYGRDYGSQKAVKRDLLEHNKDFIIADIMSPWDGKPVNASQLREEGVRSVTVRYGKLRKVMLIRL